MCNIKIYKLVKGIIIKLLRKILGNSNCSKTNVGDTLVVSRQQSMRQKSQFVDISKFSNTSLKNNVSSHTEEYWKYSQYNGEQEFLKSQIEKNKSSHNLYNKVHNNYFNSFKGKPYFKYLKYLKNLKH